jgi:hypothetical protein
MAEFLVFPATGAGMPGSRPFISGSKGTSAPRVLANQSTHGAQDPVNLYGTCGHRCRSGRTKGM